MYEFQSPVVGQVMKAHHNAEKYVAAICAAPITLKSHGIPAALVTSHPSVRSQLEEGGERRRTFIAAFCCYTEKLLTAML